jgi:hypothetical protein
LTRFPEVRLDNIGQDDNPDGFVEFLQVYGVMNRLRRLVDGLKLHAVKPEELQPMIANSRHCSFYDKIKTMTEKKDFTTDKKVINTRGNSKSKKNVGAEEEAVIDTGKWDRCIRESEKRWLLFWKEEMDRGCEFIGVQLKLVKSGHTIRGIAVNAYSFLLFQRVIGRPPLLSAILKDLTTTEIMSLNAIDYMKSVPSISGTYPNSWLQNYLRWRCEARGVSPSVFSNQKTSYTNVIAAMCDMNIVRSSDKDVITANATAASMTFRKGVNGERRASSLVENGEIHSYPRILLAMCVASKSFIMDFYRDHQNDESNSWDIEWFRFGSTMTLLNQLLVGVKRIANIVGQRTELWSLERFGTSQAWVLDETPIAADPSESVKVNMDSKDTGKSRLILKYLQHPSMTVPFTMYLTRRKFIGEVEFKKSTASNLNHRGSPLTPEQLNVFNADIQRVFLPGVMTCHVFRNCIVTWAEKIGKSRSFRSNLADYMQHDLKLAENVYNLFHASQVVESFGQVG